MTSNRPYRSGMSQEGAVAELRRCSGTQFDPTVVDAFCAVLGELSREAAAVGFPTETSEGLRTDHWSSSAHRSRS
jgi:HD-GYP domain-containing protein (c-di-GMP phosphodiesterase class II)